MRHWTAQAEKKRFHSFILPSRVSSELVSTRTQLKTYRAEIARAKLARVRFAQAKLIRIRAEFELSHELKLFSTALTMISHFTTIIILTILTMRRIYLLS
jgi:hypothetical protein